ncbi:EamA family transporter [Zhengella mangrovi]|uniref:EamA family transporter n=1 Tax=Zhengella mangrovi TaxID=1982044 RepID=A0A2G1QMD3_9HYPH|nr:DMT family transporter [Zhengella mangrovi]PHP66620.1 EamA family transporter [Zhengella mangrovi]
MIYELAALATAFTWALTSVISPVPAQALGPIAFVRARMTIVFVLLAGWLTVTGGWQGLAVDDAWLLVLSGFVGIFLGDTALFATMNRLGPRRSNILFSLNAPISAILGRLVLGEVLSHWTLIGMAIVFAGVTLAILYGKRPSQLHQWEHVRGPLWAGIAFGLAAALSQAAGSLIARPVMAAGMDPVVASTLRIGVAAAALSLVMATGAPFARQRAQWTWTLLGLTAASGIIGMALGVTLLLFALSGGKVGIVSILSATTPALLLPLLWIRTGERPAAGAWIGAALVVTGSALILNR